MSYVAEPYLYVTDQILTALTGGVGRESHRFFAGANSFSFELGTDVVITESVRVIGQAGQTFFSFREGIDFTIDLLGDGLLRFKEDEKAKGQPDSKATWPDEGSEFFVSYYHSESGKALLTDRNTGSLTRTLVEAFARELSVLRKQLELVYRSGFVDTAEGVALDMVVALLGLDRKSREYAAGSVRFFRETPASADIYIPEGTRVSTDVNPPVSFVTIVAKTLRRGQLSVELDVRAEVKGALAVVAAKTIQVINQAILGITAVINDAPTVFGGGGESDVELRARAKKVVERAGKATPRAIIGALTELKGLKENHIKVVEDLQLRPGVVQVFVAQKPTAALATAVQEKILDSRAAGIRVEHNLAVVLPQRPKDSLPTFEGRDDLITVDVPVGEDFTLPMICDVLIFPDNPRLTGVEKTTLTQAVQGAIAAYITTSAIGGTIVYNQLVADLMALPGILDVILDIRAKGDTSGAGKRNIQVPDGRRAVIAPEDVEKDITVHFIGEVNFDFRIKVALKGAATLADAEKEIRQKLMDYFAGNPSEVSSSTLMTKLGVSDFFNPFKPTDLKWTVEYGQAGLVVHEQGGPEASTQIASGDRPILRDVKVET